MIVTVGKNAYPIHSAWCERTELSDMSVWVHAQFCCLDVKMYCSNMYMNESLCYSNRCGLFDAETGKEDDIITKLLAVQAA
jgi:hypothetical protein